MQSLLHFRPHLCNNARIPLSDVLGSRRNDESAIQNAAGNNEYRRLGMNQMLHQLSVFLGIVHLTEQNKEHNIEQ
jgi:hypothetical protein